KMFHRLCLGFSRSRGSGDHHHTILDGVGGYSRKPVKVVVLLAKKSESVSIFRLVKQIDHQAFISQSIVRGVYGEGFDQIKT
ncbi:MAG: DUF2179 domain-containing protein, partial [Parabacteroides distasonis]|nr:DUF2179 domain-containing protein [Parabacteroides distasonis]